MYRSQMEWFARHTCEEHHRLQLLFQQYKRHNKTATNTHYTYYTKFMFLLKFQPHLLN